MRTPLIQRQLAQLLVAQRAPSRCLVLHHHHHHHGRILSTAQEISPAPSRSSFSTSPRFHRQELPSSPIATSASASSAPPSPPPPPSSSSPASPFPTPTPTTTTSPPPKTPRRRPRWVSATILFLVGALSGTVLRAIISPPPPPLPGSPADEALKDDIRALAQKLPIVQQLLAEPGWTHHEAYSALPESSRPGRITTGPLSTAAGIGAYQHIFHPPPTADEPIINVVFFGLSTTGWPGVVHGGLLSTLLDEHSARAALAETAAGGKGVLTANLDLTYLRPTLAGGFYVVKARARRDEELEAHDRGKRARKIWVDVWLETPEGLECVRGRALFVIPKGGQLRGVEKGF